MLLDTSAPARSSRWASVPVKRVIWWRSCAHWKGQAPVRSSLLPRPQIPLRSPRKDLLVVTKSAAVPSFHVSALICALLVGCTGDVTQLGDAGTDGGSMSVPDAGSSMMI